MFCGPRATSQDGDHEGDPYCHRAMMMHPHALLKASPGSGRFTSSVTIFDVLVALDQRDCHREHPYALQKASRSAGALRGPEFCRWWFVDITQFL